MKFSQYESDVGHQDHIPTEQTNRTPIANRNQAIYLKN